MRDFEPIDPTQIKHDSRVIGSMADDRSPNITYYILLDGEYAIICVCDLFTNLRTGETEWLTHQLEMPKSGIRWIVHTLENKFLKLSHEGGLPADVRHFNEFVDGEELGINRSMGLGSNDNKESGYSIYTHSRKNNIGSLSKKMSFTDSFLFERGFFDLLKDIAIKIESGVL